MRCQVVGHEKKGGVPQKGDILVYTGGTGHVAIAETTQYSWHQNWSGNYVQRVQWNYNSGFSYNNVARTYWGCIRPNFDNNTDKVAPKISYCKVVGVDSNGYMLECEASDNIGLSNVKCATWTSKSTVK